MIDTQTGYWLEIRNDHTDETNLDKGVVEMMVDAWVTDDDNEEGKVIAKILAVQASDGTVIVQPVYIDERARADEYAQVLIQEGIRELKNYKF